MFPPSFEREDNEFSRSLEREDWVNSCSLERGGKLFSQSFEIEGSGFLILLSRRPVVFSQFSKGR